MMRAAGTVARVLTLRDDALASEQASVLKDQCAVVVELLIQHEA
jgi:hypothetical protein